MYIHYTGYIITEITFPYGKFPYHISTESSFYYEMLNPYYASIREPFNNQKQFFNAHLMNHVDYYLPIKLSVPVRYLFLKTFGIQNTLTILKQY